MKLKCNGKTGTEYFRQRVSQMTVSCGTAIVRQFAQNDRLSCTAQQPLASKKVSASWNY